MKLAEYIKYNRLEACYQTGRCNRKRCDLRIDDPDFNKGHGNRFFNAFDRAMVRGDFK